MSARWGFPTYRCIGERLARAELETALCGQNCAVTFVSKSRVANETRSFHSHFISKLPNLRLGIPHSIIKYTAPTNDAGINELPVVW